MARNEGQVGNELALDLGGQVENELALNVACPDAKTYSFGDSVQLFELALAAPHEKRACLLQLMKSREQRI